MTKRMQVLLSDLWLLISCSGCNALSMIRWRRGVN